MKNIIIRLTPTNSNFYPSRFTELVKQ